MTSKTGGNTDAAARPVSLVQITCSQFTADTGNFRTNYDIELQFPTENIMDAQNFNFPPNVLKIGF